MTYLSLIYSPVGLDSYRDRLENEKSQTLSLQEEGRRREAIARKRYVRDLIRMIVTQ
jgi:hypothetical protein